MLTLNDFDYRLPSELIAQFPLEKRDASRLMVLAEKKLTHTTFSHLLDYINEHDLLVFNDTRVIPARLFGAKASGGKIECLIERVLDNHHALAHLRASHSPKIGTEIILENKIPAIVIARENDLFKLQFLAAEHGIFELLEQYGHMPLPPYITRLAEKEDSHRYQTVFAKNKGAVAAPTAGLHFDEAMMQKLREKKIETGFLTLHVGAGTFQPIRAEKIEDHVMHSEWMTVSPTLSDQIYSCKKRGGRVIAIGTTVVRALESAALSGQLQPYAGDTAIFITPGFQFRIVDALLTNFHLPKSTLLMLVCAFGGYERVMYAYHEAIQQQYRFFSYGDAMLVGYRS